MKYKDIREESLKLKVASDYFGEFDTTKIFGNIDFCVAIKHDDENLFGKDVKDWHNSILWAEAKKGNQDINSSLAQLILTIGKARTFDEILPPPFLGVFDYEKIVFLQYSTISDIFYMNDFNWNVTPSNHETKEFKLVLSKIEEILKNDYLAFDFEKDDKELKTFIKNNFRTDNANPSKIKITKNNFMIIYNKWLQTVKPTIGINWGKAKESGIIDGDFYLADILSVDNKSIKEKLYVLLQLDHYEVDRIIDNSGFSNSKTAHFNDNLKAHNLFWNRYERPPREEYWDYIVERRDLLVPQDVRERKGSYFTPQIWVELSQKYLTDTLGENWQDEYYIWDCAAGTGNLLNGLTNKYNIWASTLDKQDVDVMKDRIKNGANLLESHVFQFDFLNDDFSKLPNELQKIINDEEKRKKLVIYINPPYVEAASSKTISGTGDNKTNASNETEMHKYLQDIGLGKSSRELFVQFLLRIYFKIPNSIIANFSKTKIIQSSNFKNFRKHFKAKLVKLFLSPSATFDNVTGHFPIGFFIWKTSEAEVFDSILADVYDSKANKTMEKLIVNYDLLPDGLINDWLKHFTDNSKNEIAAMCCKGNDFQNNNLVNIDFSNTLKGVGNAKGITKFKINATNLIPTCIYFSVRHSIDFTWVNDRDQFLHPNDGWKEDIFFQSNCLIFTLFHSQNRISSKNGINQWIPFAEQEVNAKEKFESNFMSSFLGGNLKIDAQKDLFSVDTEKNKKFIFSSEAKRVLDVGRELWRYYHSKENINVNASLYDIKEYFQGRDEKSNKMNNKSNDQQYNVLISDLKDSLKLLAKQIESRVYEYGFLKV